MAHDADIDVGESKSTNQVAAERSQHATRAKAQKPVDVIYRYCNPALALQAPSKPVVNKP